MRRTLLLLVVVGLAVVGADPAAAQDPCEPSCDDVEIDANAVSTASVAPVIATMAALIAAPRLARRTR